MGRRRASPSRSFWTSRGRGKPRGSAAAWPTCWRRRCFRPVATSCSNGRISQDVLSEQDLGASGRIRPDTAAAIGQVEGAEILVTGNITEFEAATSGGQGGLGVSGQDVTGDKRSLANKLFGSVVGKLGGAFQSSHLAIDMRLVDTRTGRVVAAASVKGEANDISGLGSAAGSGLAGDLSGYAKTPMEKAIRLAIQEAVQFVVAQTPAQYYRAPQPVAATQQWPQQPAAGGFPGQGMPSAQQVPIPGQAGFPGQQPGYPQARGRAASRNKASRRLKVASRHRKGSRVSRKPRNQASRPKGAGRRRRSSPSAQGQPGFPQQPGYPQPPQAGSRSRVTQGGHRFPQQGFPQAQGGFPPPQGQSGFPQASAPRSAPRTTECPPTTWLPATSAGPGGLRKAASPGSRNKASRRRVSPRIRLPVNNSLRPRSRRILRRRNRAFPSRASRKHHNRRFPPPNSPYTPPRRPRKALRRHCRPPGSLSSLR